MLTDAPKAPLTKTWKWTWQMFTNYMWRNLLFSLFCKKFRSGNHKKSLCPESWKIASEDHSQLMKKLLSNGFAAKIIRLKMKMPLKKYCGIEEGIAYLLHIYTVQHQYSLFAGGLSSLRHHFHDRIEIR